MGWGTNRSTADGPTLIEGKARGYVHPVLLGTDSTGVGSTSVYAHDELGQSNGSAWTTDSTPEFAGLSGQPAAGVSWSISERFLVFTQPTFVLTYSAPSAAGPSAWTFDVDIELNVTGAVWSSTNLPDDVTTANRYTLETISGSGSVSTSSTITIPIWAWDKVASQEDWTGRINVIFSGTADVSTGMTIVSVGDLNVLKLPSVHTNRMSMAGKRRNQRWFVCPREGWPHPISEAVRDGEKRAMLVSKRHVDQRGRRNTRGHGRREREPRLWPHL